MKLKIRYSSLKFEIENLVFDPKFATKLRPLSSVGAYALNVTMLQYVRGLISPRDVIPAEHFGPGILDPGFQASQLRIPVSAKLWIFNFRGHWDRL